MEELDKVVSAPARILIIDDQESARALLKRRLAMYRHEVFAAASENSALDILNKHQIDAIFLNMFINGNSSYEFLKKLKDDKTYQGIPIIMISSDSDVELVVKCIEAGAEDYLVKPLNQTILRARLANCIAKKESHDKELAYLKKIEQGQKQIASQEKMASLGALVNSISQELKNPLNFVINFAEVCDRECNDILNKLEAQQQDLKEEFYQYIKEHFSQFLSNVHKITEYGREADKIIRFMQDQSNTSEGQRTPADINKVIQQTITMLFSSYKTNGITRLPKIDTKFDHAIPHVMVSIQSVSKAIHNVIDNSVYAVSNKYDNIADGKILITSENLPSEIKITVSDNGGGIADDIMEKIFTPFFTTKTDGSGPGLGLSTAKEIISDHGGSIDVVSNVGDGTIVTIVLKK